MRKRRRKEDTMEKVKKGEHGYIKYRKKVQFLKSLVMFLIAAAIFILGLALNDWEKSNVFTIFAVLCVLPAAKQLVGFIVLVPYHSVADEVYNRVTKQIDTSKKLYTDLVITSPEKVMNLSFLAISGNQVIGLVGREQEKQDYMEKYLRECFKNQKLPVKATVLKDETKFIQRVNHGNETQLQEEEQEALKALLLSLMV